MSHSNHGIDLNCMLPWFQPAITILQSGGVASQQSQRRVIRAVLVEAAHPSISVVTRNRTVNATCWRDDQREEVASRRVFTLAFRKGGEAGLLAPSTTPKCTTKNVPLASLGPGRPLPLVGGLWEESARRPRPDLGPSRRTRLQDSEADCKGPRKVTGVGAYSNRLRTAFLNFTIILSLGCPLG